MTRMCTSGLARAPVRASCRRASPCAGGAGAEPRGAGTGSAMLQALAAQAAGESAIRSLKALVHPDNAASLRLFEGAGFRRLPETEEGLVVLVRSPSA